MNRILSLQMVIGPKPTPSPGPVSTGSSNDHCCGAYQL